MKKSAFTLVEILIVVVIIGLLSAVGIPAILNSISNSRAKTKEMNVASVEAAKEQWALAENKSDGDDVYWSDIADYFSSAIDGITDLTVDGDAITLGKIGTKAHY